MKKMMKKKMKKAGRQSDAGGPQQFGLLVDETPRGASPSRFHLFNFFSFYFFLLSTVLEFLKYYTTTTTFNHLRPFVHNHFVLALVPSSLSASSSPLVHIGPADIFVCNEPTEMLASSNRPLKMHCQSVHKTPARKMLRPTPTPTHHCSLMTSSFSDERWWMQRLPCHCYVMWPFHGINWAPSPSNVCQSSFRAVPEQLRNALGSVSESQCSFRAVW